MLMFFKSDGGSDDYPAGDYSGRSVDSSKSLRRLGCGEMRLLAPALWKLSAPVVLINPPAEPSVHGLPP